MTWTRVHGLAFVFRQRVRVSSRQTGDPVLAAMGLVELTRQPDDSTAWPNGYPPDGNCSAKPWAGRNGSAKICQAVESSSRQMRSIPDFLRGVFEALDLRVIGLI